MLELADVTLSLHGISQKVKVCVSTGLEGLGPAIEKRVNDAVAAFDIEKEIDEATTRLLRSLVHGQIQRLVREAGDKVNEATKRRVRELVMKELAEVSDDRNEKLRTIISYARAALIEGDSERALRHLEPCW